MPIKWSAVAVQKSMDEVEQQVNLAQQFIDEAKTKNKAALTIPHLPDYMTARIKAVGFELDRMENVRDRITAVRNDIPDGAIAQEERRGKHGRQQTLIE